MFSASKKLGNTQVKTLEHFVRLNVVLHFQANEKDETLKIYNPSLSTYFNRVNTS